jgi:hypothetical protein
MGSIRTVSIASLAGRRRGRGARIANQRSTPRGVGEAACAPCNRFRVMGASSMERCIGRARGNLRGVVLRAALRLAHELVHGGQDARNRGLLTF